MGNCKVEGCIFDGIVEASGTHAGGIVGGGYTNSSAPNGIHMSVNQCTSSGNITGADKVGGILGGDSFVAQAWDSYTFSGNTFTGKVEATNGNYKGGIIGYYESLNKYDDIRNNYFSRACGAEKGIGFVHYVDTSCTTHETTVGDTYFKVTGLANGDSVQSYKSSNTKIFTVTKNGVLKAGKKSGKATLTITLASGLQKKVTVKVQKKTVTTSKITSLQKKVTLKKGAKLALKPSRTPITSTQKFTYSSSNKKIATVNKKGVITGKKAGKTKITVKSGKKKYTVTVTVTK